MRLRPSLAALRRPFAARGAWYLVPAILSGLLAVVPGPVLAAESYQEMLAQTDTDNAHELYELAMWCRENRYHPQANRHLKRVVEIEPDHQGARAAMGQLYHDGEWKHFSMVPGGRAAIKAATQDADEADQGGQAQQVAVGPAPQADEVDWDLTVPEPKDPQIASYLQKLVREMHVLDNWSGKMESNWRTLLEIEEYRPHAFQAWATVLSEPDHNDIFGAVMYTQELFRRGGAEDLREIQRLLPFITTASERVTDGEELYFFASIAGALGERKTVPRLIQLLDEGGDAADGARQALHEITLMPTAEITKDKAEDWWKRHHDVSPAQLYGDLLDDADPMKRLNACRKLYPTQDQRIVPTLIEILGSDNRPAIIGAADLLEHIAGNDWGLGSMDLSPQKRRDNLERLESWWDENQNTFVFLEFRQMMNEDGGPAVVREDPIPGWIRDLNSLDTAKVNTATEGLRGQGNAAVPALIAALGDGQAVTRSKARDLLREITGQNFGFKPIVGSERERAEAQAAWKAWAEEQGLMDQDR